jgi:hypothetical protein
MIFWTFPDLKPNRKNFCELFNPERAYRRGKALKESIGIFPVSRFNLQQNTFISVI